MSAQPTITTTTTALARTDRIAPVLVDVAPDTAASLRLAFDEMFAKADEWAARASAIRVTSVDQKREMKLARESRLALREIRINAEHARKRLKEDSTRRGKAVDGIANVLKALIEPIEAHLLEQETFAERIEETRRTELAGARADALRAYGADPSVFVSLGEMLEETWTTTLADAKAAHEAKLEAARHQERVRLEAERIAAEARETARAERARLEAERVEKEKAQAAEVERLRLEAVARDEELRRTKEAADAAARDADALRAASVEAQEKATAERERIEAVLVAERSAAAKAAADRETQIAAEQNAALERSRAARVAEGEARAAADLAPDREKILAFAATVRGIPSPKLTTERGKKAAAALEAQLEKLAAWIDRTAAAL